jgi:hypothetical protein
MPFGMKLPDAGGARLKEILAVVSIGVQRASPLHDIRRLYERGFGLPHEYEAVAPRGAAMAMQVRCFSREEQRSVERLCQCLSSLRAFTGT